jgi:hypothetical protein
MKLDCNKKIEELSLVSLLEMSCRFFVMVCKKRWIKISYLFIDEIVHVSE